MAAARLTTVFLAALGGAAAKQHMPKASATGSHIVAHVTFGGLSTVDMAMQRFDRIETQS